jgi:hypothetical protein
MSTSYAKMSGSTHPCRTCGSAPRLRNPGRSLDHQRGGGPLAPSSHARRVPRNRIGRVAVVDRPALRHILLELQDLRARQGCDWTWMDALHPSLRRELDAAIEDEQAVA